MMPVITLPEALIKPPRRDGKRVRFAIGIAR